MAAHPVSAIDVKEFGAETLRVGDLNGDGAPDLLFTQSHFPTRRITCLTATDIFGRVLWQRGTISTTAASTAPPGAGIRLGQRRPQRAYVRQAHYADRSTLRERRSSSTPGATRETPPWSCWRAPRARRRHPWPCRRRPTTASFSPISPGGGAARTWWSRTATGTCGASLTRGRCSGPGKARPATFRPSVTSMGMAAMRCSSASPCSITTAGCSSRTTRATPIRTRPTRSAWRWLLAAPLRQPRDPLPHGGGESGITRWPRPNTWSRAASARTPGRWPSSTGASRAARACAGHLYLYDLTAANCGGERPPGSWAAALVAIDWLEAARRCCWSTAGAEPPAIYDGDGNVTIPARWPTPRSAARKTAGRILRLAPTCGAIAARRCSSSAAGACFRPTPAPAIPTLYNNTLYPGM